MFCLWSKVFFHSVHDGVVDPRVLGDDDTVWNLARPKRRAAAQTPRVLE